MIFISHTENLISDKHVQIRTDRDNEKSDWLQKRIQEYYLKGYTVDVDYL